MNATLPPKPRRPLDRTASNSAVAVSHDPMFRSLVVLFCLLFALAVPVFAAPPPPNATQAAPARQVREFQVLAVAGLEYRLYYQDWKDRMRSVVAGASRHMEASLGLRFTVAET